LFPWEKWIEFDFCGNNKIATVLEASGPAEDLHRPTGGIFRRVFGK